jgi:hypothetical protein
VLVFIPGASLTSTAKLRARASDRGAGAAHCAEAARSRHWLPRPPRETRGKHIGEVRNGAVQGRGGAGQAAEPEAVAETRTFGDEQVATTVR